VLLNEFPVLFLAPFFAAGKDSASGLLLRDSEIAKKALLKLGHSCFDRFELVKAHFLAIFTDLGLNFSRFLRN